jgi:hypothetical protein
MGLFGGDGGGFFDRISDIDVGETAETVADVSQRVSDAVEIIQRDQPTTPPIRGPQSRPYLSQERPARDDTTSTQGKDGPLSAIGGPVPALLLVAGAFLLTR